jgi:hypothetical protein
MATFKRAARGEALCRVPAALIVDSPWIPGFLGIGHLDYFAHPGVWFDANLRIMEQFHGVDQFMVDLVDALDGAHQLLEAATTTIIRWLEAQAETIGNCVERVFLPDDIVGFFSKRHYIEFAEPSLKRTFGAFRCDGVKVCRNDANVQPFLAELAGAGLDVLNWIQST